MFSFRPATQVFFNERKTSRGMPSGRLTILYSSKMSIRPIIEPSRPLSPMIAPTMLPGLT